MSLNRQRIGTLSSLYAALFPVLLALEIAFAIQREALLLRAALRPAALHTLLWGGGVALAAMFALGLATLIQQRARQRHSPGRARLMLIGALGALSALASATILVLLTRSDSLRLLDSGLGAGLSRRTLPLLAPAALVVVATGLGCTVGSIAAWWLVPSRTRARVWVGLDAVLVCAVAWAIVALPSQPPLSDPRALQLPVLRYALIAFGVIRLLIRVLPYVLSGIERVGFKASVAARHLRSKKSGFLAAISLLSVLAVSVSCVALTVTLSVMGGFRNDLKRKILGNNAHIVVDRASGQIADWEPLLRSIRKVPRVTGAAPFVGGEVMLSSASNLATAVLRGIDPKTIGQVNDLPKNLKTGRLEYLEHPEKLLELPAELPRTTSLMFDSKLADVDGAGVAGAGGGAPAPPAQAGTTDNSAGAAPAARPTDPSKRDLEQRLTKLEALLRDIEQPKPSTDARELLPGIIIGQELARSLRLYVGDEVNVVAPLGELGPSGPMPKSRPYRVAGIFYSGMYEYDMKFTYVGLAAAQRFLGIGDSITGIEVRVTDVEHAPETADAIRRGLPRDQVRVRDWQALNSRLFGALAFEKLAMFIALCIAILVASFCVAGTLTLMVQEKGREVAILKAMGTSDRSVVGVFVIEGGLIGVLGASLGLFLGYLLCFAAEHFGIRMNPEVYYIDRLPVQVDPAEFALTGIAAVLVCLVVTIYPALLASRLRPVDALRYE
jgi:lipoprotein-releasing system permease protein